MSMREMLNLQGFNPKSADRADGLSISKRKFAGMVGNAISVDVLETLGPRVV